MKYADVIIPLKFRDSITYSVPQELEGKVTVGSLVRVTVVGRAYTAVVLRVKDEPEFDISKIKPIKELINFPPVTQANMDFLRQVASYYMCSLGEVFRFAAPSTVKVLKHQKQKGIPGGGEPPAGQSGCATVSVKASGTDCLELSGSPGHSADIEPTALYDRPGHSAVIEPTALPVLSPEQTTAIEHIRSHFTAGRNVLLHGVTGSGKTEIYITLAAECLKKGQNVLYLVPEIAVSRQIQSRLAVHFPDSLLVYHSKQTAPHRREVYSRVASDAEPYIVLGLRSALFLPHDRLGLIIVDEEHDQSYKQTDQAPRYHGRDTALMLGRIQGCPVLLGSATPSFESLYNVRAGRLEYVPLTHRYFEGGGSTVTIVDMPLQRRRNAVKGSFSLPLLKAIATRLERHEQVLVFRSRRAYASAMECPDCGFILRCPSCNIPMSYHKFSHSLSCHWCGYSEPAPAACPQCGKGPMSLLGDGTEKIEEELRTFFPEARIERFDADTTKDKKEESRILKQFSEGKTDILVGTQMISKGFDFKHLTLTAVLKAEAVTSVFDFRADERALQLLLQFMGRAGRRDTPGEMIIQTSRADHPVFRMLRLPEEGDLQALMEERREFGYPPFSRIIRLLLKSQDKEKLDILAKEVSGILVNSGFRDICGPAAPPFEKISGEFVLQFMIKTDRSRNWTQAKERLYSRLRRIPSSEITIDVDPV